VLGAAQTVVVALIAEAVPKCTAGRLCRSQAGWNLKQHHFHRVRTQDLVSIMSMSQLPDIYAFGSETGFIFPNLRLPSR
jgi:hypothetical protein